jgi:hypothetical protein
MKLLWFAIPLSVLLGLVAVLELRSETKLVQKIRSLIPVILALLSRSFVLVFRTCSLDGLFFSSCRFFWCSNQLLKEIQFCPDGPCRADTCFPLDILWAAHILINS